MNKQVFDAIKGRDHPSGILKVIEDEVYCFVASYFNFADNELYVKEVNKNHEEFYKPKEVTGEPRKKPRVNNDDV